MSFPVPKSIAAAAALTLACALPALAAPPNPKASAVDQLLDFGESAFPNFFPQRQSTLSLPPFLYRYYPATGTYLGVVVTPGMGYTLDGVYVLGGAFGAAPAYVGQMSSFITPTSTNRIACSTFGQFTLARGNDGSVWGWGENTYGQLGDGTLADKTVPTRAAGIANAAMLATSKQHSVVLLKDGTVRAMGNNKSGQLGSGSTTPIWSATPVAASVLNGISSVAASDSNTSTDTQGVTVATRADGSGWYWGYNTGRLDNQPLSSATAVRIDGWPALALVKSAGNVAALAADGGLWAWGVSLDVWGVGGSSAATPHKYTAVPALADIAVGSNHSVALSIDGRVFTWGANSRGELGYATPNGAANPTPMQVQGLGSVVAVAAGQYYSLALTEAGRVYAWGYNYRGRMGLGTPADQTIATPTQIPSLTNVSAMCAGWMHAAFVRQDGSVWVAGDNSRGQLGLPSAPAVSTVPVQATGINLN